MSVTINIDMVADLLGLERIRKGYAPPGTFNVVCPFCGDRRGKMNLVVDHGGKHNLYNCYNCTEKGTMYDLYARVMGLTGTGDLTPTRQAAKEIRERVYGTQEIREYFAKMQENKEEKAPAAAAIAPAGEIDRTYRTMLFLLHLRKEDRADLLRRGLAEGQIDRLGFRSVPDRSEQGRIARELIRRGCQVKGVPGFYTTKSQDWAANFWAEGYFCPAFSVDGRISGLQIRLSKPKNGSKYIWFSSANQANGCSPGSPASFIGDPMAREVYITDGILKAVVIHELSGGKMSVIGIPGVNNFRSICRILPGLPHLKKVFEATDMDRFLDTACGQDEGHKCSGCPRYTVCPHKAQKKEGIQRNVTQLLQLRELEPYQRNILAWDYHRGEGEELVWNGRYKGLDDYMYGRMDKKEGL